MTRVHLTTEAILLVEPNELLEALVGQPGGSQLWSPRFISLVALRAEKALWEGRCFEDLHLHPTGGEGGADTGFELLLSALAEDEDVAPHLFRLFQRRLESHFSPALVVKGLPQSARVP